MKKNQMKFVKNGNEMKFLNFQVIDLDNFFNNPLPLNLDSLLAKNEIAVTRDNSFAYPNILKTSNYQIIDVRQIKKTIKKVWNQWFPFKDKNATMAVGVFWTAFMQYIFPWCLDLAKVYCAWKIVQGFYQEGKGVGSGGGGGGRGGFGALVHYGKWYVALSLVPWGVMLIDEVAHKMSVELMSHPINLNSK